MAGAPSLAELQTAVHEWISQWEEGYFHPLSNLARLTEEVGELAREINHRFGDKPRKPSDDVAELSDELGDVMFVLLALANQLEVDLADATLAALAKYDMRDLGRFTRST